MDEHLPPSRKLLEQFFEVFHFFVFFLFLVQRLCRICHNRISQQGIFWVGEELSVELMLRVKGFGLSVSAHLVFVGELLSNPREFAESFYYLLMYFFFKLH